MARIWCGLIVVLLARMGGVGSAQPLPRLAIIVHRSNPIDNLTHAELRQIFLLERQSWPNNKKITVIMRDSGQVERASLLREVCGMSEADFARHVLQATFRGTAMAAPRTISTADGMRRFVFNVPGAVGYVRADEVDDSIKVVRLDGKLPGDPGYALAVASALSPGSVASTRPR